MSAQRRRDAEERGAAAPPSSVRLFAPCLTQLNEPRVVEACVAVLEHLGISVDVVDGQTCCGQPLFTLGEHRQAAKLARRMKKLFGSSECVVTPSPSCAAMVNQRFPELGVHGFEVVEFARFLRHLGVSPQTLGCRWAGTVTVHESCHGRHLPGGPDPTEALLDGVAGLTRVALPRPHQCCGFGGSFASEFGAIAAAIGEDKCEAIGESKADWVVTNDAGCALSIRSSLARRGEALGVRHLAEVLAESLGLMPRRPVVARRPSRQDQPR